jgi:hypothetical protein
LPNSWVRLWHEMPTDPKWRVIARKSGQAIATVIAIYNCLMVNASANGNERGIVRDWDSEDIGAALDIDERSVDSVIEAMQGKVLDGWYLSGWEKRQPKQEDGSAERAKNWRERKRTVANGNERPDKDADADAENTEKPPIVPQGGPVAVPDSKPKKPKATMTAEQREWFGPWWESYPRKEAKQPAEITWGRIVRDKATADAALVGLKAQLPDLLARERDKIPHPATWINQRRWTDEIRAPTGYPVRDVPGNGGTGTPRMSWRGEAMKDLFYPVEDVSVEAKI